MNVEGAWHDDALWGRRATGVKCECRGLTAQERLNSAQPSLPPCKRVVRAIGTARGRVLVAGTARSIRTAGRRAAFGVLPQEGEVALTQAHALVERRPPLQTICDAGAIGSAPTCWCGVEIPGSARRRHRFPGFPASLRFQQAPQDVRVIGPGGLRGAQLFEIATQEVARSHLEQLLHSEAGGFAIRRSVLLHGFVFALIARSLKKAAVGHTSGAAVRVERRRCRAPAQPHGRDWEQDLSWSASSGPLGCHDRDQESRANLHGYFVRSLVFPAFPLTGAMSIAPSDAEAVTWELDGALSRMAIVAGGCAGSRPSPPAPRRPRPLLVGEAQGRVRLLQSAAATVGELKDELEALCSIPAAEQMLSCPGDAQGMRAADCALHLPDYSMVFLRVRCLGGKGGFGAMLRNQGSRPGMKQVEANTGAMRDLSGRRLRHVEQEAQLQDWVKDEGKRKQEKEEEKKEKRAKHFQEVHAAAQAYVAEAAVDGEAIADSVRQGIVEEQRRKKEEDSVKERKASEATQQAKKLDKLFGNDSSEGDESSEDDGKK